MAGTQNTQISEGTKKFAQAWVRAEIATLWEDPVKYVVSEDVTLNQAIAKLKKICDELGVKFETIVSQQPQPFQYAMGLLLNNPVAKTSVKIDQ